MIAFWTKADKILTQLECDLPQGPYAGATAVFSIGNK